MYVSPVDVLGISLSEFISMDAKNTIRFEKLLKAKFAQGHTEGYNSQQFSQILQQLKDPEAKQAIYFVEQHPELKKFITDGTHSFVKTFSIDSELLADTPNIDRFLAPYFETYFYPFIKKELQRKRYDVVLRAMENKSLFTNDFLDRYYRLVIDRLLIIIETIKVTKAGKLYNKLPEITYKTYVQLLNTVPIGLIRAEKINYINAMVDYYNLSKNRYKEFSAIRRVFDNIGHLYFEDFEMKRFVKKLSAQITNVEVSRDHKSSSSSDMGRILWGVMVISILLFRFAGKIGNSGSSSSDVSSKPNVELQRILEEKLNGDENISSYFSRIKENRNGPKENFFNVLRIPDTLGLNEYRTVYMTNLKNPYTNYFYNFPQYSKSTKPVDFYNRQEVPVILFRLNQWREQDRAGYFGKNSHLKITVLEGDSLVFYKGKNFSKENIRRNKNLNDTSKVRIYSKFKNTTERDREIASKYYVIDSVGGRPQILITPQGIDFKDLGYRVVD